MKDLQKTVIQDAKSLLKTIELWELSVQAEAAKAGAYNLVNGHTRQASEHKLEVLNIITSASSSENNCESKSQIETISSVLNGKLAILGAIREKYNPD